jgi:hypothetical protein
MTRRLRATRDAFYNPSLHYTHHPDQKAGWRQMRDCRHGWLRPKEACWRWGGMVGVLYRRDVPSRRRVHVVRDAFMPSRSAWQHRAGESGLEGGAGWLSSSSWLPNCVVRRCGEGKREEGGTIDRMTLSASNLRATASARQDHREGPTVTSDTWRARRACHNLAILLSAISVAAKVGLVYLSRRWLMQLRLRRRWLVWIAETRWGIVPVEDGRRAAHHRTKSWLRPE